MLYVESVFSFFNVNADLWIQLRVKRESCGYFRE